MLSWYNRPPVSTIEYKSSHNPNKCPYKLRLDVYPKQPSLISFRVSQTECKCDHRVKVRITWMITNNKGHHYGSSKLQIKTNILIKTCRTIHHNKNSNRLEQQYLLFDFTSDEGRLHQRSPHIEYRHYAEMTFGRVQMNILIHVYI